MEPFPVDRLMFSGDAPVIMGILNVTPDSFSDGGSYKTEEDAIAAGIELVRQGARIIDIGGESTRPGAQRISAIEQIRRVTGVIRGITDHYKSDINRPLLSIDTTLAEVAEAALDAGASIVNDVSAGREDPQIFDLTAQRGTALILMHMQGTPQTMQHRPQYQHAIREITQFLLERTETAKASGVRPNRIVLDPGIGFGKTTEHNIEILASLPRLTELGYPVMLGASRKRFFGEVCQAESASNRLGGTCATTALGVAAGVAVFRVHDVEANRQALQVALALRRNRDQPSAT